MGRESHGIPSEREDIPGEGQVVVPVMDAEIDQADFLRGEMVGPFRRGIREHDPDFISLDLRQGIGFENGNLLNPARSVTICAIDDSHDPSVS